jgi:hypothetical protein
MARYQLIDLATGEILWGGTQPHYIRWAQREQRAIDRRQRALQKRRRKVKAAWWLILWRVPR